VILYIAYVAVFYAVADTLSGGFATSKPDSTSPAQVRSVTPNLLLFHAKPLAVFLIVAVPIVLGLHKVFRKA
jgi:hypothetical protein